MFNKNKFYERIKKLCCKIYYVSDYSNKINRKAITDTFAFETNLGLRHIIISSFEYADSYTIYYLKPNYDGSKELIFHINVSNYECNIYYPEYKVGLKQITTEEINLALLELENEVNSAYEKYLVDLKYHKEQEAKLFKM